MFKIISIEGNIGSGKSTFLERLRKHYADNDQVIFSTEPVHLWENIKDTYGQTMLQKFYGNQEKYAFSFQMMAYISRLSILRNIMKMKTDKPIVIITERSLYTDKYVFAKMLYDDELIEDVNYQIYDQWFYEFASELPIKNHIYLKANPDVCYNRIHSRSRAGEEKIPLTYLSNCHNYHEEFISHFKHSVLDANQNVFDENVFQEWLQKVDQIISELV
jgi:deoxyguanosine kinase